MKLKRSFPLAPFSNPTAKSTLVLHIGGPKCGSSSLQTFLTQNSTLKTNAGEKIEYWKIQFNINKSRKMLFTPISRIKLSEGLKYEVSDRFEEELNEKCLHEIFENFVSENSHNEQKIFVFSQEGWSHDFQKAKAVKCKCNKTNFTILIYLSVRPQLDLLIPSYLQWTIFSETPTLERTVDHLMEFSEWNQQIENSKMLGADKILVKYTPNIVEDFCNELKIDLGSVKYKPLKNINRSLPVEVIALLLKNRDLRPGPHASEMDFLIEDYLDKFDVETEKVVIKVAPAIVSSIEVHFRESNLKLENVLDHHNAFAYRERLVESKNHLLDNHGISDLTQIEIDPKFLENFLVALLKNSFELIQKYDKALRELESLSIQRASMPLNLVKLFRDFIGK
jgi:hypothetical protein